MSNCPFYHGNFNLRLLTFFRQILSKVMKYSLDPNISSTYVIYILRLNLNNCLSRFVILGYIIFVLFYIYIGMEEINLILPV